MTNDQNFGVSQEDMAKVQHRAGDLVDGCPADCPRGYMLGTLLGTIGAANKCGWTFEEVVSIVGTIYERGTQVVHISEPAA